MKSVEERRVFSGLDGPIETIVDLPPEPHGIALVCHPHPLYGGNHTNKVAHTLAKAFAEGGYLALRPNFRGVGGSGGSHDQGEGETADMLALIDQARIQFGNLPMALAGFSFGAYVQTRVAEALTDAGNPPQRLVLVGLATGTIAGDRNYVARPVAKGSLVIHGAHDTTVPLANVLAWAEPQDLPIVVIPGADHFFHRRLHTIREIVRRAWRP